jgi:hypothetical protein
MRCPNVRQPEKLQWLRDTGWLSSYELRSESTYLITQTVGSADSDTVSALVGDILANSEDDQYAPRRAYTLLTSIEAAAPDLGIHHPRSTRLNLADLSDAPAHEITSPALSNQDAGPMKPAVGHAKWLVAALAIRRSHCQRYARPLHVTTRSWSDRELRPYRAKLEATAQALIVCEAERSSYEDQRRWVSFATVMGPFELSFATVMGPPGCQ